MAWVCARPAKASLDGIKMESSVYPIEREVRNADEWLRAVRHEGHEQSGQGFKPPPEEDSELHRATWTEGMCQNMFNSTSVSILSSWWCSAHIPCTPLPPPRRTPPGKCGVRCCGGHNTSILSPLCPCTVCFPILLFLPIKWNTPSSSLFPPLYACCHLFR